MMKNKNILKFLMVFVCLLGIGVATVSANDYYDSEKLEGTYIGSYKITSCTPFDEYGNAMFTIGEWYSDEEKHGILTKSRKILIEPKYDWIDGFHDGLYPCIRVYSKDRVTIEYRDCNGAVVIPAFKVDIQLWGANYTLGVWHQYYYEFSEGYAIFKDSITHKYGYIDKSGKIVIAPQFDEAHPFCDGLAGVMVNDKWGYIDKTGRFVIQPKFGSFEDEHDGWAFTGNFYKGYAGVYLGSGQILKESIDYQNFAIIDKNGNIVKRFDYLYPRNKNTKKELYNPMEPIESVNETKVYFVRVGGQEYQVNYCGQRVYK